MPYKNKEDKRRNWNKWREKNRIHNNSQVATRKRKLAAYFREYKSKLSCNRCNEKHPSCIVFHHPNRDGKEKMRISLMISNGYGKERILKEISLCEIVCLNCHAKEHWQDILKKVKL